MLSYFLADDTLSIFEPPQRNTGITGGKYLERSKVMHATNRVLAHVVKATDLLAWCVRIHEGHQALCVTLKFLHLGTNMLHY